MQSYDHRVSYTPHRYPSVPPTSSRPPQIPPRPRHATLSSEQPSLMSTLPLSMPQPSIPASLTPGRQRTRSAWDTSVLTSGIGSPSAPSGSSPFSGRMSLYGDYFFSQPPPPLPPPPPALPVPQRPTVLVNTRPPIPPKPSALITPSPQRNPLYPQSIPINVVPLPLAVTPSNSWSRSPAEDKNIALALALSASEANHYEQELVEQDEELAKALEESRLITEAFDDHPSFSQSSQLAPSTSTKLTAPPSPTPSESWLHMSTPTSSQPDDDEHPPWRQPDDNKSPSHKNGRPTNESFQPTPVDTRDSQFTSADSTPVPSLYSNAVSGLVTKPTPSIPSSPSPSTSHTPHRPTSPSTISLTHTASEPPTSPNPTTGRYSAPSTLSSSSDHSVSASSLATKSSCSLNTALESSVSLAKSSNGDMFSPATSKSPMTPASPNISMESSHLDFHDDEEDADLPARPTYTFSANQYVDADLLIGVSLGFDHPVISSMLTPMKEQMPNVIRLPYGKAPILFFQAPSWRRLLKLMARLSATRMEPTLEALAVAKHELKLRTVIQFVKVHHSSPDWRAVLYFTTDMPLPSSVQTPHKYTNGDVSVLPFSYTLSPLPALLRDGPEASMAKYYVIPSTLTTPYPSLPINFPDLAMYLQSAVQDSRRASSDSSSGMRKLAQYIDSCFPCDAETAAAIDDDSTPRKGVGGIFKRVIGRSKGPKGNRVNEEIYDLVTPFVADEWG